MSVYAAWQAAGILSSATFATLAGSTPLAPRRYSMRKFVAWARAFARVRPLATSSRRSRFASPEIAATSWSVTIAVSARSGTSFDRPDHDALPELNVGEAGPFGVEADTGRALYRLRVGAVARRRLNPVELPLGSPEAARHPRGSEREAEDVRELRIVRDDDHLVVGEEALERPRPVGVVADRLLPPEPAESEGGEEVGRDGLALDDVGGDGVVGAELLQVLVAPQVLLDVHVDDRGRGEHSRVARVLVGHVRKLDLDDRAVGVGPRRHPLVGVHGMVDGELDLASLELGGAHDELPEEGACAHFLDGLRDPLAEVLELVADHRRRVGDVAPGRAQLEESARGHVGVELDARERARADLQVRPRRARVRRVGAHDRSQAARVDELVPAEAVTRRTRLLSLLEDRREELVLGTLGVVEALDQRRERADPEEVLNGGARHVRLLGREARW